MDGAVVIPNEKEPCDMTPTPNGGIYETEFEALIRQHLGLK